MKKAILFLSIFLIGFFILIANVKAAEGDLIWMQADSNGARVIAEGVTIDSTGIYVVGRDESSAWRIEKRTLTTGNLIWKQISSQSGSLVVPYDVAVDSTGIYVVGHNGGTDWRIDKRSTSTGALITSFDGEGIVTSNPSSNSDIPGGIAIDSSGIYVVGSDFSPGNAQWRIEKRNLTTGALITSFDGDGVVTFNPSSSNDIPYSVAVDSTGIYVVGFDNVLGLDRWRIEKRSNISYIDCGFRIFDGALTITIACEPLGTLTSALRIAKAGNIYGVVLVVTSDSNASKIRIQTSSGIKALRKL